MNVRIRTEQIDAMGRADGARFLDRLVDLVTGGEEPDRSDPALRQECRERMLKAVEAGFASEFEVATFVLCSFEFGDEFDRRTEPPFQQIMCEPDTAPRLKAAQLLVLLEESEPSRATEPHTGS